MGGSCRHVPPKDDNSCAWWAYGLDVITHVPGGHMGWM